MNIIENIKRVQSKIATDSDILNRGGKINTPRKPSLPFSPSLLGSVPCVSHSQRETKAFTCHVQLCRQADLPLVSCHLAEALSALSGWNFSALWSPGLWLATRVCGTSIIMQMSQQPPVIPRQRPATAYAHIAATIWYRAHAYAAHRKPRFYSHWMFRSGHSSPHAIPMKTEPWNPNSLRVYKKILPRPREALLFNYELNSIMIFNTLPFVSGQFTFSSWL